VVDRGEGLAPSIQILAAPSNRTTCQANRRWKLPGSNHAVDRRPAKSGSGQNGRHAKDLVPRGATAGSLGTVAVQFIDDVRPRLPHGIDCRIEREDSDR